MGTERGREGKERWCQGDWGAGIKEDEATQGCHSHVRQSHTKRVGRVLHPHDTVEKTPRVVKTH